MESRKSTIQNLSSFIDECECRLNNILDNLRWSKESVRLSDFIIKDVESVGTDQPTNATDTFPPSFQAADSICSIKLDNITQAEAILEEVYSNPSFELGVSFEELTTRNPPSSLEDLHVNFTREERLALYNHALKNTTKPPEVPEVKIRYKRDERSEAKATSLAEIAAIERDARRRNPKHRVSRNPLTYNEQLKQLIQLQTEALTNHIQQSTEKPQTSSSHPNKESKRTRKSRSRSVDSDRRTNRKKKRHRSRTRERSNSDDRKHRKSHHKKHKKKHDRCPWAPFVDETATVCVCSPKSVLIERASIASPIGVDVACAFTYPTSATPTPASFSALRMASSAPVPSSRGAVRWDASPDNPYPSISPSFTHDESITTLIERTRGCGRFVVERRAQRSQPAEPGNAERTDASLRSTAHHHIRIAMLNEAKGISQGMGARGTGRGNGVIRSPKAIPNAKLSGRHIGQDARNKEGTDAIMSIRSTMPMPIATPVRWQDCSSSCGGVQEAAVSASLAAISANAVARAMVFSSVFEKHCSKSISFLSIVAATRHGSLSYMSPDSRPIFD
uniref:CHHC U11-48K-type domain-containing protein n=1 Tax=Anopheles dirus TaxID=7168 RepID=A0A182N781_9DIPT